MNKQAILFMFVALMFGYCLGFGHGVNVGSRDIANVILQDVRDFRHEKNTQAEANLEGLQLALHSLDNVWEEIAWIHTSMGREGYVLYSEDDEMETD